MVSYTYHIHLESATIQLPDMDDLLGKYVEVIVRELKPTRPASNFDALNQLLISQSSPDFFKQIEDPSEWQNKIRDEWE